MQYKIIIEGCDALLGALRNISPCLGMEVSKCEDIHKPFTEYVGLLCGSSKTPTLRNGLIRLLAGGCDSIVLVQDNGEEWRKTDWADECAGFIWPSLSDLGSLLDALNKAQHGNTKANLEIACATRTRFHRRLQAEALHEVLQVYSHNSRADLANRFLAPARMLLESKHDGAWKTVCVVWTDTNKDLFTRFKDHLDSAVGSDAMLYGELGVVLRASVANLIDIFNNGNEGQALDAVNQLMALITECRNAARARTPSANLSPALARPTEKFTPIPPGDKHNRRILVIDDDWESWRHVLAVFADRMGPETDVYVAKGFSGYASRLHDPLSNNSPREPVLQSLPDFDLVLLDIYLERNSATGIAWLAEIRRRIMHVPILLWTTSTDRELPAQASLANGFVFKKTAKLDDVVNIARAWLDGGRSQRLWSLPHPFFDHAIRTPEIRETALAFTKWTLRYMDCFHAVDHFYFRYFNDHGGRHILGILDVAAKLLRPLIFAPEEKSPLSLNKDVRERQLCCLYLAVLCHEFGMFPIVSKERGSLKKYHRLRNTGDDAWNAMEAMRKLHAVRGMLMLLSNKSSATQYDVQGLSLYQSLACNAVGKDGWAAVAVLVGYHQRCMSLKSDSEDDYLTESRLAVTNDPPDAQKSAGKTLDACAGRYKGEKTANGSMPEWLQKNAVFTITSESWLRAMDKNLFTVDALRRLCALMRFSDALDVDQTRVPADFLLDDRRNRRPNQEVEDAKRQVVEDISIDSGRISIKFSVDEPSQDTEIAIQKLISNGMRYLSIKEGGSHMSRLFNRFCWLIKTRLFIRMEAKDVEDIEGMHMLGDDQLPEGWLTQYRKPWPERENAVGSGDDIQKQLHAALLIYATCAKYRISSLWSGDKCMKKAVSTAAAILAILEIEDEYRAIQDVEMQDVIQLSSVEWSKEGAARVPSVLELAQ